LLAAGATQAEEAGDTPAPVEAPAAAAVPSRGSVFFDPLGFLLFGPTAGAEVGFGQYSVLAFGRWFDGGLLARSMFTSSTTSEPAFSYGAGLKGRYYFRSGLLGPHFGLAFEVLKTRGEDHVEKIATNNVVLVPEIEGGYRLGFGRFYLGATGSLGYALQVKKSVDNIDGGDQAQYYEAKDYSTFYGSASLDVGLLF